MLSALPPKDGARLVPERGPQQRIRIRIRIRPGVAAACQQQDRQELPGLRGAGVSGFQGVQILHLQHHPEAEFSLARGGQPAWPD